MLWWDANSIRLFVCSNNAYNTGPSMNKQFAQCSIISNQHQSYANFNVISSSSCGRVWGFRPTNVKQSRFYAVLSWNILVTCHTNAVAIWRSSDLMLKRFTNICFSNLIQLGQIANSSFQSHFGCLNSRSHFLIHDPTLIANWP